MNKLRGYTEVVIGGKKRPVKFGTNQTIIFCQQRGITLGDYSRLFEKKKLKALQVDGSEMRDLVWSSLVDGARYKKQAFDFTPEDIGDWIDEADEGTTTLILSAYLARSKAEDENAKKK